MSTTKTALKPLSEMSEEEIDATEDFSAYFDAAERDGTLRQGEYYEYATGRPLPVEVAADLRPSFPTEADVNAALRRLLEIEPDFRR